MHVSAKTSLLMMAAGGLIAASAAQAVVTQHGFASNAVAHCQAFTPGPANTIRNRVVGSENIGTPINVACVFEKLLGSADTPIERVFVYFANNAGGTVNVSCTLLTGFQGGTNTILNKNVNVTSSTSSAFIAFSAADTPEPDIDLNSDLAGVNCNVPTGVVITETYLEWDQEDGVGV